MNKKEMILSLIEHYSNGNKAQFARILGITPQGLSTWISRGTFDIELVYAKCEDISPDWLLTGRGEMCKTKGTSSGTKEKSPLISELLDTIKEQAETIGRLKARIEDLENQIADPPSDMASAG